MKQDVVFVCHDRLDLMTYSCVLVATSSVWYRRDAVGFDSRLEGWSGCGTSALHLSHRVWRAHYYAHGGDLLTWRSPIKFCFVDQDIKYFYDITDRGNFKVNPDYKGVCHVALAQEGHTRPGEVRKRGAGQSVFQATKYV